MIKNTMIIMMPGSVISYNILHLEVVYGSAFSLSKVLFHLPKAVGKKWEQELQNYVEVKNLLSILVLLLIKYHDLENILMQDKKDP